MTLANLKIAVKTQIRAELASGSLSVSDIHDDSISQWAGEEIYNVILMLGKTHYPALNVIDGSLTFSSGSVALPNDFWWPANAENQSIVRDMLSLKLTIATITKKRVRLVSSREFARYDDSNFALTPSLSFPIGMIADKIYIKPTTPIAGYFDYIKTHQAIASGTQFDEIGDNVLVRKILARYFEFNELHDLQIQSLNIAKEIAGVNK